MNNALSIVSSLIIFLFPYLGRKWFNRQLLSSTVITLGLLGTFGGIMYGLWVFSVERIDQSIPQLLEGLKTAFLTSIAGMVSSVLLKLCPAFYGIREVDSAQQETSTEEQLLQLLNDIRENTRPGNRATDDIKRLLENSNTLLTGLSEHLRQISRQEMELNTEALTSALQDVVTRLDQKISEQINVTLAEIHTILTKQLECTTASQQINRSLDEHMQNAMEQLREANQNTELFLNKSTNLNFRQNETLTTQMSNFGNFVKNSQENFQTQLNRMEEKYERELSEMEKFTKTLLLIIKKLSQDHESLYKQPNEQNN